MPITSENDLTQWTEIGGLKFAWVIKDGGQLMLRVNVLGLVDDLVVPDIVELLNFIEEPWKAGRVLDITPIG